MQRVLNSLRQLALYKIEEDEIKKASKSCLYVYDIFRF